MCVVGGGQGLLAPLATARRRPAFLPTSKRDQCTPSWWALSGGSDVAPIPCALTCKLIRDSGSPQDVVKLWLTFS